jgi:hypothetical protein
MKVSVHTEVTGLLYTRFKEIASAIYSEGLV